MAEGSELPESMPVVALVGPTAVGKTDLALELAERLGAEIVSMDSMQVYRFMDIGTAKPSLAERRRVRHHLIDVVDPDQPYHAAAFVTDAWEAMAAIRRRQAWPLLVGGTGLYLRALSQGLFAMPALDERVRQELRDRLAGEGEARLHAELAAVDPQAAARIHPHDHQRLLRALEIHASTGRSWSEHLARQGPAPAALRILVLGLTRERRELAERIQRRVASMMEQGFVNEVENLLGMGYDAGLKSMQSIGYRHVLTYLGGVWSWEECLQRLATDTRRYAKRQLTWFRRQAETVWHHPRDGEGIAQRISQFLAAPRSGTRARG
ncbi:MAG: tRNA (adenosine(37)-N6)-dimethylallyltransferase MiaA [Thermodesulfobacteriota bacterium]